jgi:L-rhamnose mutarotase
MKSLGYTLLLKDEPELVDRYKREHQQIWPEVAACLREAGVEEIHIYLAGRRLFMHVQIAEGIPEDVLSTLTENPSYRRWDELMRSLQEPAPEAREGEWWALLEQIFDLRWSSAH